MGSFLGSIHVRTDDCAGVRAALPALAKLKRCQFLAAPTLRGWTSVYPSGHGQDKSISRALAKKLSLDVVHVLVHDDDIFAYFVYRSSKLLDEYDSNPDYFEPVSARKKARVAGRPERFTDLLKEPNALPELRRVLAEHPLYAHESLERFAALLDLPNAATSYEYLIAGDTDGVEAFDRFVRVPEVSEHEQRRAQAQQAFDSLRQDLRHRGVLLAELAAPRSERSAQIPVWCAHAPGGLLLAWTPGQPVHPHGKSPILQWTAPWSKPPGPLGMQIDGWVHAMVASPSGRYLAVGFASGKCAAQLWDLDAQVLIAEIPASRLVGSLVFSPDERILAIRSHNQLDLADTNRGEPLATLDIPGEAMVAFHPSGRYLAAGHTNGLAVVEWPGGRLVNTLCIGGVKDVSAVRDGILAQMRAQLGDLPSQLDRIQRTLERFGPEVRQQAEERLRQFHAAVQNGEVPGLGSARQSVEQARQLVFTPEGQQLCLATNAGVRVYSWDAILSARESTPPPLRSAEAEPIKCDVGPGFAMTQSYTYDLVHDSTAGLLLFCGLDGKVRALGLSDARVMDLAPRLDFGGLLSLALSSDRSFLFTQTAPMFEEPSAASSPVLRIWDYAQLLASPALRA